MLNAAYSDALCTFCSIFYTSNFAGLCCVLTLLWAVVFCTTKAPPCAVKLRTSTLLLGSNCCCHYFLAPVVVQTSHSIILLLKYTNTENIRLDWVFAVFSRALHLTQTAFIQQPSICITTIPVQASALTLLCRIV